MIKKIRIEFPGSDLPSIEIDIPTGTPKDTITFEPKPMGVTMNNKTLSPRERQVLQSLCEGKANKIIAYDLGLSQATVKVHIRKIMKKLGASNRTELALKATAATTAAPSIEVNNV